MSAPKRRRRKCRNPLINMDPTTNDDHYRYKFERLITKTQGKNTGQRTILANISQIADDILGTKMESNDDKTCNNLRYTPKEIKQTSQHICTHISKAIGGRCQFKNNIGIVSGVFAQNELQKLLFDYVSQYAMCPKCNIPELTPHIYRKTFGIQCKACPYKQSMKNGKKNKPKTSVSEDESENKQSEAELKQERMTSDPIFALQCFVSENETKPKSEAIMEKIKLRSIAHSLDRKGEIKMVIYGLMNYKNESLNDLIESIKEYKPIFEAFTMRENDTMTFLAFMEETIVHKSNLLKYVHRIFMCLYDEDIICEDEMIEWYDTQWHKRVFTIVSKEESQMIKDKITPFIQWLQKEEESD